MSAPSPTPPDIFSWVSTIGRTIIREIIEERLPQWPNGPHDTQVECWAHSLQAIPTILIASTGWGKRAAFFGPILVLEHLVKHPKPGLPKIPSKPVVLVVTPLIELGNAHAREIAQLGLSVVAISAETLTAASDAGRNLYHEICQCKYSIVLLSAERLVSPDVDAILRNPFFRQNLILLGIDEVHVLIPWGKEFRKAYHQISLLRRRLPSHTGLVAVTATLSDGDEYRELCSQLNLKEGLFKCIRLSSERPNIRTIFKELTHPLGGSEFPDIAWVFTRGIKAVVYCEKIEMCFRVASYGWAQYPDGVRRLENVRLWTSLTSVTYNTRTLELFKDNVDTSVIVATIAFGMGMNIRNITHSINLGLPSSLSVLVQQNGRAGRDLSSPAYGWTYVEGLTMSAVRAGLSAQDADDGAVSPALSSQIQKRLDTIDPSLCGIIEANINNRCLIAAINTALGNPGPSSCLSCEKAGRPYCCSTCQPFWNNPSPSPRPPGLSSAQTEPLHPTLAPPPSKALKTSLPLTAPLPPPLNKPHRVNALTWLEHFAKSRWCLKHEMSSIPHVLGFWEGTSTDEILAHFHLLRSRASLDTHLASWAYLPVDGNALFELAEKLNRVYDKELCKKRADQDRKRAETARKAAATRAFNKDKHDKENRAPVPTPPSNPSSGLTIQLPARRPLVPTDSNPIDDSWEPPVRIITNEPFGQFPLKRQKLTDSPRVSFI
ncbi:P-loop containing nucleoside triphosphate hydrolase protein [Crassisporium funariophilum]|nr:P-loop containing nucleoside triphosphate hydrolase protein [Crassisporium funariophilum]